MDLYMDFSTDFFWHTLLAALVASFWFSLPGLMVLRLLGFSPKQLSTWLVAPAFGLCIYGSFSLAIAVVTGYTTITLITNWLMFITILKIWTNYRQLPINENFCHLSWLHTLLLMIGIALWAMMATANIYPFYYQGGIFVNSPIFDHGKVAIVDAIAREGLLPKNPYYAPDGETIRLIYYFTWHFLTSQLKLLVGVTGWQAEVAFTWFTGVATLSFLCALAIRIAERPLAGYLVWLLAFCSFPTDLLAPLFRSAIQDLFALPPVHGLELLWLQMMWVPQHVCSALAVVILLFLTAQVLKESRFRLEYALIISLSTATAFGSSVWVGGVALILVSPILLLMIVRLRLPHQNYLNTAKTLLLAIFICSLIALPAIIAQISGPGMSNSPLPFGIKIYPATRLFANDSFLGLIGHIILFWLQFLPLNLGIIYVLGILALFSRAPTVTENSVASQDKLYEAKAFLYLSIGGTVGYLLIIQFAQSTIINNDLGWRAVLVPIMLLMVWSAVAFSELAYHGDASKWRPRSILIRLRWAIQPITMIGLTIGILSTIRVWQLPEPIYTAPSPEVLARHRGFYRQIHAWAKVREYTAPTDKVQANPDGYADITTWPATLPYALLADRSTAYANVEFVTAYAYRYDRTQNQQQYQLVQNIFSAHPSVDSLRQARDRLKVKAILIDQFDAAWQTDIIEKSGIYRLSYQEADFKIYLAEPSESNG
jgi:hypothetical protein